MTRSTIIAASILSADFARLGEEVGAVLAAGSDWVHVDVMDGHFVPNLTIGPVVVEALRKSHPSALLDVHLMIEKPERYVEQFAKAGANYLSIHQEACSDLKGTLEKIRAFGAKPAVVINPGTPAETVQAVLPHVDMVLVMSVNPGFGGQKFIPDVVEKIEKLARWRKAGGLKFLIEIDGGINEKTAGPLKSAGVDVFVAGNAIFKAADYRDAINKIRAS